MSEYPSVIQLSALNGSNGFRLQGFDVFDGSGHCVASAGDINGDGFDDLIIGAWKANGSSGESYVVFGKSGGFASTINLGALNGTDGFRISGASAVGRSGYSVSSAGDINGDGFDDILVGAWGVASNGFESGASYVLFGKSSGFATNISLSTLNGSNGFRIAGQSAGDNSGFSVSSAGDINNDGFDDLFIGARAADPNGTSSGASYVIFGKAAGFTSNLNLSALDGSNGFRISGISANDTAGYAVASAGDVNGDGFADLIIGAPGANGLAGSSFVIFGKSAGFSADLALSTLNGTNGFRLDGIDPDDRSGQSVASAGDINGDGFDDLIIGAYRGDPGGRSDSGESYVVFGKSSGFAANFSLSTLNGTNGFRIDGITAGDSSGFAVASAGDVNGDGYDDIIIGANLAGPNGNNASGETYVVFGKSGGFSSQLDLSSLNGTNGFRLEGIATADRSGYSVASAGDVNNDGFSDLIIGALIADGFNGSSFAGESYFVYGFRAQAAVNRIGTNISNRINGGVGNDTISGLDGDDSLIGWEGADTIAGDAGNDTLNGGSAIDVLKGGTGNDVFFVDSAGEATELAGQGVDTVNSTVSYILAANLENLKLLGSSNLSGKGNSLANVLTGNQGDNVLTGAGGKDTLKGGLGRDVFDFNSLTESGTTGATRDLIADFDAGIATSTVDRIDVSTIDALPGGINDAFVFGGPFIAGHIRAVQAGANTLIQFNTDADTAPEMVIQLNGVTASNVDAGDFIL